MDLRLATLDDALLLFTWRNDPLTRQQSHSIGEIDFASHLKWLKGSIANPARRLYVAETQGLPVGTVRADTENGLTKLSWTVAPESRGRGFGTAMVKAMVRIIAGPLEAEIKTDNIASVRIAIAAGFTPDHVIDGVDYFTRR